MERRGKEAFGKASMAARHTCRKRRRGKRIVKP
jgi:hypothetical protein